MNDENPVVVQVTVFDQYGNSEKRDVTFTVKDDGNWYMEAAAKKRVAYRARMEALVEYAQHLGGCNDGCRDRKGRIMKCDCGLDALLAACEREEG